jgi:transcriptional regulator with XRE-family HTH domain
MRGTSVDINKEIFAERFKKCREENNLTQEEMASKLGVKRGTVAAWEASGYRIPELTKIFQAAEIFDVSVDYLLDRTDDPRPVEEITDAHQRIEDALADDPDAEDLLNFWMELKEREDLFLLFKQVRPLSDDSIRRVIRVIKAIEDEEAREFGDGV